MRKAKVSIIENIIGWGSFISCIAVCIWGLIATKGLIALWLFGFFIALCIGMFVWWYVFSWFED